MSPPRKRDITLVIQNAGVQVALQIVSKVLGTVIFIMLAGVLGPESLGMYAANIAYVQLILTVATMGVLGVVQREVARDRSSAGDYLSRAIALRALMLALCFPLAIGISVLTGQEADAREVMVILFLSEAVMGTINVLTSFFQAFQKSHLEGLVRLAYIVPYMAAVVLVLKLGGGLVHVLYAGLGISLVALVLALFLLVAMLPDFKLHFDPRGAWRLARQGMPFFFIGLVANWNVFGSVLLLERLVSQNDAGNFAAAEKLVFAFLFIIPSTSNAVIPALAKLSHDTKDALREMLGYVLKYLTMIGLPIGVVCLSLGGSIIDMVYEVEYSEATPLLGLLGSSVSLAFINHSLIMALIALRRERQALLIVCVNVVVHLIPAGPLSLNFGAEGMAWSVVLRHVWSLGFSVWICRDLVRDLPRWTVPKLTGILGAGVLMGLAGKALQPIGVVGTLSALAGVSLVYGLGLLLFRVIDNGEIGYVRHSLQSLRR